MKKKKNWTPSRQSRFAVSAAWTHELPAGCFATKSRSVCSVSPQTAAASPSLHPATNTPRRHDLFVSFGPNSKQTAAFPRPRAVSLPEPRTPLRPYRYELPFVTPGPPELHFYSGRHVRARVRLHLRRVTGNNNTEIGEGRENRRQCRPEMPDAATEYGGKCRRGAEFNDTLPPRGAFGKMTFYRLSDYVTRTTWWT